MSTEDSDPTLPPPNAKENFNPVHFHDGQWWFWDEVWQDRIGPFDSEEKANEGIRKYCIEVLGYEQT